MINARDPAKLILVFSFKVAPYINTNVPGLKFSKSFDPLKATMRRYGYGNHQKQFAFQGIRGVSSIHKLGINPPTAVPASSRLNYDTWVRH